MINIGTLGLWHLGCVYSACLAKLGFNVVAFDSDKKVIENLQKNISPIFEPGLEELITKYKKNITFTTLAQEAIQKRDYVFITLDTPVDNHDRVSLKLFNTLVNEVKKNIQPKTVLVISSQVPIGTCRIIEDQLRKLGKNNKVLYFPENLRLGQAIEIFLKPDRLILGGEKKTRQKFLSDFKFRCPVLEMSLESAEMSKHAMNFYLALMISFCSEISDLCEYLGPDAMDVMKALKADQRVSKAAPLNPGIGFAGGTLGRDLQTLKMVSKKIDYDPKLVKATYQVNQDRLPHIVRKISNILSTLKGKRVGLLGLTYKPNTNTLRRSQSLELADILNKRGADVRAIDPVMKNTSLKKIELHSEYNYFFKDLDVVILMTWWDEFRDLKPSDFAGLMKKRIILDTRNFLDKKIWEEAGFKYYGIGLER